MTKEQLIELIKSELLRQGEAAKSMAPYIYDEDVESFGIDGKVDLTKLADVIIEAMAT